MQIQPYQPVKVLQRTQGTEENKVPVSNPSQPSAKSLPNASSMPQMASMSESEMSGENAAHAPRELSQDAEWSSPCTQSGACDMGYGWQYDESLAQAQAQAMGYDIDPSGRYVYTDDDMSFY